MVFAAHQNHEEVRAWASTARHSAGPRWGRMMACLAAMAALTGAVNPGQQAPATHSDAPYYLPAANLLPDASQQMETRDQQHETKPATDEERKKQIGDESARLLKLATELKTEVDKTTKDTLSLEVIRKADEIERLAHGVKEQTKLTAAAN
ncbi:MAG: hypothetical protein WBE76_31790 [Terracidiphilus sp.]